MTLQEYLTSLRHKTVAVIGIGVSNTPLLRRLLAVSMREVTEETGLQRLELLHPGIFSLECLTVDGHEKRGQYVPSHIHMNVTYLLGAMDHELRQKPDENSGVAWFTPEEALKASTEPWMVQRVYSKLTQRAAAYMAR